MYLLLNVLLTPGTLYEEGLNEHYKRSRVYKRGHRQVRLDKDINRILQADTTPCLRYILDTISHPGNYDYVESMYYKNKVCKSALGYQ